MEIKVKKLIKKQRINGIDFTIKVNLHENFEQIDISVDWGRKNSGFTTSFSYIDNNSLSKALDSVTKRMKAIAEYLNGWTSVIDYLEECEFDLIEL